MNRLGPVIEAMNDLLDALNAVGEGVAVTTDADAQPNLPALVLGPPRMVWDSSGQLDPTEAVFTVFVVVDVSEHAIELLSDLVVRVARAVDERVPSAAVTRADPGIFTSGTSQLPCYDVEIEVDL